MAGRIRAAAAAGLVLVLAGEGLALQPGSSSAAAAIVPTITLPGTPSVLSPVLAAVSRTSAGTVYVTGPDGGPHRSELRRGSATPEVLGPVTTGDGAASIQADVVAIPEPGLTSVRFRRANGIALGSVPLAAGEAYLGQAGGLGALVGVPGTGGLQLVRRVPGAADAVLGGGIRADAWLTEQSDATGALLRMRVGDVYTLRYLDLASGALTTLTTLAADGHVQGVVFDLVDMGFVNSPGAGSVGWIDGLTVTLHSRADLSAVTTRTLPRVLNPEWVSGTRVGFRLPEQTTGLDQVLIRDPAQPSAVTVGTIRPAWTGTNRAFPQVLGTGAGTFVVPVSEPGGIGLVAADGMFETTLFALPRLPAPVTGLTISGGRVGYVDTPARVSATHSQQVVADGGTPRLSGPATTFGTPGTGFTQEIVRGSRTVLVRTDRGVVAYGGGTSLPGPLMGLQTAGPLTGLDGNWLVYGDGSAAGTRLADLRTGAQQTVLPTDVDSGFRYTPLSATGPVQRIPYDAGGTPTTVLPAGLCPIAALEARQGDVLIRCTNGEGRIYGPAGGAPVFTFVADESSHLGSGGLLWRAGAGGLVTATAYRTPGAVPIEVFRAEGSRPWAVDRDGPWAVHVDATDHIVVSLVPGFPVPSVAGRYVPVTPFRLLDTRTTGGPLVAGADRSVPVASVGDIPPDATDVAVSVTVTQPTASSFVAAYPDGQYGGSSTANFASGQTVTVLAVVPIRNGRIALRLGGGSAHVVLDAVGYHRGVALVTSSGHVPLPPARIFDSRLSSPVTPASPRTVPIAGLAGVPASAQAVVVNVTVVQPTAAGWLAVSPTGDSVPTTVSFGAGRTVASLAVVPLSFTGSLTLRVSGGSAQVLLDLAGYVPAATDTDGRLADYLTSGPTRLLDTRTGTGTPVTAGHDLRVQVAGRAGVPVGATAVLLSATATHPTASGFLSVYPTGGAAGTSTLNYATGQTVANAALVQLAADGSVSLRVATGSSHVILDVAGYLLR
jgi:hypothetical protein